MDDRGHARVPSRRTENERKAFGLVMEAIKEMRYGVVNIIVQDGLVVQVERTEKFRLLTPREIGEFREGEGI